MKKIKALICVSLALILMSLCACLSNDKLSYYKDKTNYITVTGRVESIKYSEDSSALYIGFSSLNPQLDDLSFKIVGANLQIVEQNKIDEKLKTGEQISFMTAPKYFGDGYVMPIVAITINGESLLEFEKGYQNWLNWLVE